MLSPGQIPPHLMAALLILSGLICQLGEPVKTREKRDANIDQPRMSSENGNLIFSASQTKNIEFKSSSYGRIIMNDEDLTELLSQIRKNKEEIAVLRASVIGSNQTVTTQMAQLSTKITNIENRVQQLQEKMERKTCNSNPCQNSGTCLNLLDSFFCLCPNNWKGSTCAEDVNECQLYGGTAMGCQNGARCQNTPGSYSCSCAPEWSGPQCTSKHDDCKEGSTELCKHGICIDLDRTQQNQPRYSCVCDPGWTTPNGNSSCIEDIDECSLPNPPCSQNPLVLCYNTIGSFTCGPCPAGWQGNGYSCQDIDECQENNGGCSVAPPVKCMNTMGSYHCGPCPPGYEGDGWRCNQVDACSVNNGGCHPLASCAPREEGTLPICVCPPGYTGNGYGEYGCLPLSDICLKNNPCVNGVCKPDLSTYLCECHPGWNGTNCTENINECASNPCRNGGVCMDGINAYTCNCTSGWTGSHCESPEQACGGNLSEPHGSILSPGYPGNYPLNQDCYWTISVDPGLYITFALGTLSLEHTDSCDKDYLEIRDGLSPHDPVIGKYCGTSAPPPLQTSGPYAWVHFHSDSAISDKGFHIAYITSSSGPSCGGSFSDTEGFIASPSWPDDYTGDKQCIYIVTQELNERINLKFTAMELESSAGCSLTVIEVKDGGTETAPLIGRYCNTTIPAPITSSSNKLWIRLKSEASATTSRFQAFYQVACGGSLSGAGVIRTPHHPNPYHRERSCTWVITQPEGEVVVFRFTSLNISSSSACGNNYVEVRDGPSTESTLIGKYCGSEAPLVIYSSQRSLYVQFLTDASSANHGFSATYRSVIEGCGATMTTPEGAITSPGYPNVYPHGVRCTWVISVRPGNLIRLSFSAFNLEHSHTCEYDRLDIYDNATDTTGTRTARYCGRSIPPTITSSDSTMVLLLVTDSITGAEGFSASYVSINASTACDAAYTEATGVFTSPNYPNNYPANRECVYTISAEINIQISLNFTSFALQSSSDCSRDYVEIRDGGYETSPLLGRFCKERPPEIISHSNKLWIKFRSYSSTTNTGFEARWESATTGCGATLTALSGVFTSPNYPMPYYHNAECYWLLKTSSGNQLEMNFQHFDLEFHRNCDSDYLAVYNGNSTVSNLLEKLCGKTLPAPVRSTSNAMYVKLRTDRTMASSGFLATYRQVCEGVLISNRSQGFLESLNYPDLYPSNKHCNWTIQTTTGNTISYTFRTFQLESFGCFDYVKLYDGPDDQARLIGEYCGRQLPPGGTTNGTALHIVFHSDNLGENQGFQLSWNINGCGEELSGPNGTFTSPGYPMAYPNNRECVWHITTSPGSSIQITIVDFDIEPHPTCNFDVLEIYGGPEMSSPRLTQLCTSRTPGNPLQVSSTGNAVTVRFKTDFSGNGRGFSAAWREVPGGCGGVFQAPSGEIHSPNYPRAYEDNTECSWMIRVSPGHRVFLNFTDFELESYLFFSFCTHDSVTVYDGESSDNGVLATLCGNQIPNAVTSTQNTMFLRLRSDGSNRYRGFSARFLETCGSSIVTDAIGGIISSPMYPARYPSNQNCSWIINAQDPYNHVTISFTEFETQGRSGNCTEDFVEVLDGDNYGSPSIGRFCGTVLPHPVTSLSNALVLRFVSDTFTNMRGFRASYSASLSACGGTLHMENGIFTSPSYPDGYPPNTECVWTLLSSPGNRLLLSFMSFALQNSDNCASDYVEIREGNDTGNFLGRFCGNTLPSNVTSIVGHILWVKFVSDGSGTDAGFQATFSHAFGNNLEGTYGQIASPLWPRKYPHHSNYIWKVNVESGRIIEIRTLDMDIEKQASCAYDKLRIFDGPDTHSRIIGTYCGVATPPTLFSYGSVVTIQFISDNSVSGRGFLLEWTAINISPDPLPTIAPGACGGILQTGETPLFLFSPGWPNAYAARIVCTWVIRSPGSTVELNLLSVDIEGESPCNNDKLVVRDGDNNVAPVLDTVCGREVPGPIRSSGDAMFLYFESDAAVSGGGFNASYHKSCGGYLHANRGLITSQNYPENYTPNQNCEWHVMVTAGFTIAVHFDQPFEVLNNDASCGSGGGDYIELKNGPDESSPPLGSGKFCGGNAPSSMHTSDNELFVRFITDGGSEGKGFKLRYEAKSLACGGTIYVTDSDPNGEMTSPNYPSNYPRNTDCVWTIIVPNGEAVQIDFQEQFDIQPSDNCSNSYLELRDGADSNSRLLAKLCGNTLPVTYKSLGTTMYVRFRTDGSTPRVGFRAQYSIAECGGTHYGQSGIIQSPGYPTHNYPDSSSCEWFFNGPTGHYLTIRFESLDLQEALNCSSDFVEVREYNASGNLLGTFCGNAMPDEVKTSDSFAYVKFVSDGSGNAKGFRLHYEASEEECGGDINGISGRINSPNYPNLYPHNRVCEWRITVPEGRRVTLTINNLQLQDHQDCNYDYVSVYNGYQNRSPLLEKLCGNVAPDTTIRSSGNTMKIIFITDGSVSSGGFQATFTSLEDAVCGGSLMEPTGGNFTSPGYGPGQNYTKNLNCEWTIQNPNTDNSSTYIQFRSLQLEPHQNCQNDFIEIRADNAEGEVISRVCGRTKPPVPLALVAPRIWVYFVSNAEVEDLGFVAEYLFTGCGGTQSGESGVVASPNFPDQYPALSHCAWLLEAPEGQIITLSFAHFDLEYHAVCRWDSVTLVNGALPGSPVIGQYCGTTSPGTVQSGSNKLLVIFNADHTANNGGFYANWTSDSLGCGGYIHADSGNIKSPGWPLSFPINTRCTWTLRTHESSHFELAFDGNFDIPDSSGQCERSFVKIWSGTEETDEALLFTACGNTVPAPIVSPGSTVKVTFQSQDSAGNGFLTRFNSRCGANYTKPSGRIVSLNYPNKYENNLNCNYTIQADGDMFVVLTFLTFELESSSSCNTDKVTISSRESTTGRPLATHCGNTVPAPISSRGTMSINFYTNSIVTMHGFMATYRMFSCGGTYNSTSGIIRSPTYSFTNYHHNMNCTYLITAVENKIIELKFNEFDVELLSSCSADYVSVYDGSDIYGKHLGKFCGKVLPPVLRSLSNKLFLVFVTDSTRSAGGWRASYRQTLGPGQGCGGYLTNATGGFGSPDSNADGKYDKNLDCVWNIVAPINKQINLTFSSFSLEAQSNGFCIYDFVKIFDGGSTNSSLQGTYCGSDVPTFFVSTSNTLTVWFYSDVTVEQAGFNATYVTTDILCGGIYNATSSGTTTTSPNFPNSYPPFTSCLWTIDSPDKENVKIRIQSFHLQAGLDCSNNYLEVTDSPVGDRGQVHRYCGNETFDIPAFYSYGRTAVVTFKSQEYTTGSGLSFTYEISTCSREYNQSFGYLKSPGWPGTYPGKLECEIILRAPENHFISLFFHSFHLERFGCYDSLEVRNGSTRDSPLLGTYCNTSLPNPIFPKNNILHLFFKSDILTSGNGYEITWTSSPKGCGGTLFGDHGSFTSPEYPASYGNNTDCEWTIVAPRGRTVGISFAAFSIDDPGDCERNYLRIYDGAAPTSPLLRTLCGLEGNVASFSTTSHLVFIKLHADYAVIPSYFRMTWSS